MFLKGRAAYILAVATIAIWPTTSTSAQVPAIGKTIWNNLTVGMSRKELKALYPQNRIQLAGDCWAVVRGVMDENGLAEVDLEWALKGAGSCAPMVTQSMLSKYGPPNFTGEQLKRRDCGNPYASGLGGVLSNLCQLGNNSENWGYYQWISNNIEITLKVDLNSDNIWYASYRPTVDPSAKSSPEAAGKL